MSTRCFRFSFPDEKNGIVGFDVTVEADNEMQAVGKLVDYHGEMATALVISVA